MKDFQEHKSRIEASIKKGDTESAVKSMVELITLCARAGQFSQAETLRDRLYAVDSSAISAVIVSGEIIEEAKARAISPGHKALWSDLYSLLTQEEANELYHSLTPGHFSAGSPLLREGAVSRDLYFIENGELKLIVSQSSQERYLKSVGPGGLLGGETFFGRTAMCTFSALPESLVEAGVLKHQVLNKWSEHCPGLHSKLQEYWQKRFTVPRMIKEQELDRRTRTRVRVSVTLTVRTLNRDGRPAGKPFRARLLDVSTGGMAFVFHSRQEGINRLLLGCLLGVQCSLPVQNGREELKKTCQVVATETLPFYEYCCRVRFERPLPWSIVKNIDSSTVDKGPDLQIEVD